jgi:hypothetical protein
MIYFTGDKVIASAMSNFLSNDASRLHDLREVSEMEVVVYMIEKRSL